MMNQSIEPQILACEERLRNAMLQSDVAVLDELLATELVFTNHLGHLMSKEDDLAAHRSGMVKIEKIDLTGQQIKILQDAAIVTVQARIHGSFAGEMSENDFRFTRVWVKSPNADWQLIVAHSSLVA